MYILSYLNILLATSSLVAAGCSVCPFYSGRCTAPDGSGCRKGEVKFQYVAAQNYCCREKGFETVQCWNAC
ncbi:uncharacterized protein EKO05_0010488 [Ascochyta rabiei]|uniref:uncharacterized protein n=1 Tax=Didymella rabiei TaxID=5454 RepID=UPI00220F7C5C|nr:uncharacterized protein EKO05_0010488 [Ascochyta rabiei]UPX20248.1 hypothetical protein EKO05_0010488 [Ascochyta rabiei]